MGTPRMPIKDKLRELREAANLTQMELAVKAGLSTSVISQIEQGTNTDPRMNTLKAVAQALGVSLDTLTEIHVPAQPRKRRRKKGGAS
jgi:transcriptional regulator with XRE-family HTH domain